MKVTIEFGEEIDPVIQHHLNSGGSVQRYIRAAVFYFNYMREAESNGKSVGFGDKSRFSSYNTVAATEDVFEKLD